MPIQETVNNMLLLGLQVFDFITRPRISVLLLHDQTLVSNDLSSQFVGVVGLQCHYQILMVYK